MPVPNLNLCLRWHVSLGIYRCTGIWFQKWKLDHLHTYSLEELPPQCSSSPDIMWWGDTRTNSLHSATPQAGVTALPVQSEAQLEPCLTCRGPQAMDAGMSLLPVPKGLLAAEEYVGHQPSKGMAPAHPGCSHRWLCQNPQVLTGLGQTSRDGLGAASP